MTVPWKRATSGRRMPAPQQALRQHAVHLVAVEEVVASGLSSTRLGPARGQQREERREAQLLVGLARRRPAAAVATRPADGRWNRWKRHALDRGRRLRPARRSGGWRRSLARRSRRRWPRRAVALQRLEQRRRAALAGEGPDFQGADHQDAQAQPASTSSDRPASLRQRTWGADLTLALRAAGCRRRIQCRGALAALPRPRLLKDLRADAMRNLWTL